VLVRVQTQTMELRRSSRLGSACIKAARRTPRDPGLAPSSPTSTAGDFDFATFRLPFLSCTSPIQLDGLSDVVNTVLSR
jgi:hypothetical protein